MRASLKYAVILVAICLLFATVYFANKQGEQGNDPAITKVETLEERVLARWGALIKGDFLQAYQFETPGYRSVYTDSQYRAGFGAQVAWLEAKVESVHEQGDLADVITRVKYQAILPGRAEIMVSDRGVTEKWLREGDQWFHVNK